MFVCGIKIWCTQDQNCHLANGAMSYSGGNQDGVLGCHRNFFSIQNDRGIRLASQNDVNFSVLLVVMLACIGADFSQVYRARKFISIGKGPPGYATWARDSWQGGQI